MANVEELTEPVGTREALLRSAISVVARQGLRGATVRAIAADAQLAHGMIVHHFGSRDALLESAMVYASKQTLRDAEILTTGKIDDIGSHLRDIAEGDQDILDFQREMEGEARRRPELNRLTEQVWFDLEDAVRRQLQAVGLEDDALVTLVAAAMDGMLHRQSVLGDQQAVDDAMEALRVLLKLRLAP